MLGPRQDRTGQDRYLQAGVDRGPPDKVHSSDSTNSVPGRLVGKRRYATNPAIPRFFKVQARLAYSKRVSNQS